MRKLLVLTAVTLCLAGPASAGPNFFGTEGLLETPTARTQGSGRLAAHFHSHSDFNAYGAEFGLGSRLDVGITYLDIDSGFGGNGSAILGNAKFLLLKETAVTPGVAVGIIDAFDELDLDPSWYAVATKGLPKFLPVLGGFRVSAGYGGGLYDNDFFVGLEWAIGTPLDLVPVSHPTFSFLAEYVRQDVNLGLRGRWKGFEATAGLFDFDDWGFGVSYAVKLR